MATFLYRLGRFSYRRRWVVLATWVLLLVIGGVGAAALSGPTSNTFSIPGTESQKALDLLADRVPGSGADGASARVVFVAPDGEKLTAPAAKAAIEETVATLQKGEQVASVADPFATQAVSQDGATAYATVTYKVQAFEITEDSQEALFGAGEAAEKAGIAVEVGGEAAGEKPGANASEAIGLVLAAIVLVITFGSLLAAGLPLLTAIVGVALGSIGIAIASGLTDLSSTTGTLATMLGLAVAIDYALFIVSRYRHELLEGRNGAEAAGRAVGTAGSAVVFAGATVVIALSALTVVGIPFLSAMGLAAAGTVAVAVLIALTLLPALLGFLGLRVLGRRGRAARDTENDDEDGADGQAWSRPQPLGARWAGLVVRKRIPVALAVIIGLGIIAVPALDLRLGLPSDGTAATDSTQRKAYDALADGFGPGFNGPLMIVADLAESEDAKSATTEIQADLTALPGAVFASEANVTEDGRTAIYTVIPASGPDDVETEELVRDVRDSAPAWKDATGAVVLVTGYTALGIDVSQSLNDALIPYLAVVIGLAFLLLLLVFRSILVPLKATLGFLLSMVATFGAVVAVFQWGWLADLIGVSATGPIVSFLPILLVGLLFGLAMDYEVFLVTRMREEHVHGASAQESVVHGFRHGARVVTAAALIMIGVFVGFIFTDETIIKSIGFALAVGVFFDAFLVRMTLVPAVMSLLGEKAWWLPRWLDRALPDVDVEGEKLNAHLATESEVQRA